MSGKGRGRWRGRGIVGLESRGQGRRLGFVGKVVAKEAWWMRREEAYGGRRLIDGSYGLSRGVRLRCLGSGGLIFGGWMRSGN